MTANSAAAVLVLVLCCAPSVVAQRGAVNVVFDGCWDHSSQVLLDQWDTTGLTLDECAALAEAATKTSSGSAGGQHLEAAFFFALEYPQVHPHHPTQPPQRPTHIHSNHTQLLPSSSDTPTWPGSPPAV